ncbi:MAG: EAL domain-containing protein [Actinomycetota bacterium]|nr:EAL domain-containing protein [Actinomycetota bacterium]
MSGSQPITSALSEEFGRIIASRSVRALFQPVVDLSTGEVLGFEALARGPEGSIFESPANLFGAAYQLGMVGELDWACRAAAFRSAFEARLHPSLTLFVNTEPPALGYPCPEDLRAIVNRAEARLRVILEFDERAVVTDPAELLASVGRARSVLWGVGLDQVGKSPRSLAVLPFVHPDVIKLDIAPLHSLGRVEVSQIVNAVLSQADRTDAVVVVQGIQDIADVQFARSLGARVGQGHHLGQPDELPTDTKAPHSVVSFVPNPPLSEPAETPYGLVTETRQPHTVSMAHLQRIAMNLEYSLLDSQVPRMLLASVQHIRYFSDSMRSRYERLARVAPLTAVVGVGVPDELGEGVRGAAIDAADALAREYCVVVVGPHFTGALVARDQGDTGPDHQRSYDMVLTYERDLVLEAARSLLHRVTRPVMDHIEAAGRAERGPDR